MGEIKVGVEFTVAELRRELIAHPERYFSIAISEGHAALCVQTCDSQGENPVDHMIDGCVPDSQGNLISIFERGLSEALLDQAVPLESIDGDDLYFGISPTLTAMIREQVNLIDWIISSLQTKDRHLLFRPPLVI